MLTFLGFLTIGVILALLLTNRVAAVVALAGVPVVTALVAGEQPRPRSAPTCPRAWPAWSG